MEDGSGGAGDPRDSRDQYRGHWQVAEPDSLTGAVVRTVTTAEGVGPSELTAPLGGAVDVDALVRVLTSGRGNGTLTVRFGYAGRTVTVRDDGTVVVGPRE